MQGSFLGAIPAAVGTTAGMAMMASGVGSKFGAGALAGASVAKGIASGGMKAGKATAIGASRAARGISNSSFIQRSRYYMNKEKNN